MIVDNLNQDSVDLTIHSDPQSLNVQIPNPASIDIDGDQQPDATLNLWYVGKDKATIAVESAQQINFKERINEQNEIITISKNQIDNPIRENSIVKNNQLTINGLIFGSSLINTILIITNMIILLFVIVAFIIKKR